MLRRSIARLPVLVGAALLVLPWMYLTWNTTVGELAPRLRFRTKGTIAGVLQEAAPKLDLDNILNYRFQRQVSEAVGRLSPVYVTAIRAKAQLYYRVFGASPNPLVTIGRGGELFQPTYLQEYCGRNIARFTAQATTWAGRIRAMQDFFNGRGQEFLYVITPSKAAQYPEYIPLTYSCPATQADRTQKMAVWRTALTRAGVPFVDSPAIIAAAKRAGGSDMFPKGGIHWNALGATLAARAFADAVNAMGGPARITPFTWDVHISYNPRGTDRDVLEILNVAWPDDHYPVPELTYHGDPGPACRPARIAEVGGSFLFELNVALAQIPCPPVIDMWFYWKLKHFRFPPPDAKPEPVDPVLRTERLAAAELVVFEENEASTPMTEHGTLLLEEVVEARR